MILLREVGILCREFRLSFLSRFARAFAPLVSRLERRKTRFETAHKLLRWSLQPRSAIWQNRSDITPFVSLPVRVPVFRQSYICRVSHFECSAQ
jgi:hypothetical protein